MEPAAADGSDLKSADYSAPERSCDVVMKGGITSGVVYPHAICELARTYRFRNVGGTSAGAIAAAATAAAEYGRGKGGFNKLADLPDWLGRDHNLQDLFQPQRGTRRLFAVLLANVRGGGPFRRLTRVLLTAIGRYPLPALVGALLPLLLTAIMVSGAPEPIALLVLGLVVGAVIALLGVGLGLAVGIARDATKAIPGNQYGLCSGLAGARSKTPALTGWLHELLNGYAGLGRTEVLTFGHLWGGPEKARAGGPEDPEERWLQLAMMTTNLTNRRAHQLPWDSREWFFDPAEFRRLFPEQVVRWMEEHPAPPPPHYNAKKIRESRIRRALMRPRLPLPAPADLPVLVATRMSLSFPVLLSAVPLWNLDMSRPVNKALFEWKRWAGGQEDGWDPLAVDRGKWPAGQPASEPEAECCWFSDGGISSNFPIHFFDRLVPRRPTFAINLRPFPPWQTPSRDEEDNVSMVDANNDGIAEWWYRFTEPGGRLFDKRLVEFLSSVMKTMQNRVDEAQMRVPGFRDRVSHVSMTKEEGGMNLTMPSKRIAALTTRGRFAARLLRTAYTRSDSPDEAITWDNHRWVRLRSSLAVLEEMHRRFADGYCKDPERLDEGERTYLELVRRGKEDPPTSYKWKNDDQQKLAEDEIEAIQAAVQAGAEGGSVVPEAPKPGPVGRIVPRD